MIDLYLRALAISGVALLALGLARRTSASVRHVLAVAGLVSTLAVPMFLAVLPSVRLAVLPRPEATAPVNVRPFKIEAVTTPSAPISAPTSDATRSSFPWSAVWAAGSLILFLRWTAGWLWLTLRLRRARPVEGLDVAVRVLELDVFRVPVTAWAGGTAILLPPGWREWPVERRDVALRHELAHVRRGDGLSLLLARLACALLWPNPFVWALARMESRLAERATDDLVLAEGFPAPHYAEALLHLAREPFAKGFLPALGMAGKTQVAHRVEMILNPQTPRTLVPRKARRAILAVALLTAVPAAILGFDPPSAPLPGAAQGSARTQPTEETAKTQVLLTCKLLRTREPLGAVLTRSILEPPLKPPSDVVVVSAPKLLTFDGMEAAIRMTSGTTQTAKVTGDEAWATYESSGGVDTSIRLLPNLSSPAGGTLRLEATVLKKGAWKTTRSETTALREGEWVSMRLPVSKGVPYTYVLVVRMTTQKGDRANPNGVPIPIRKLHAGAERAPRAFLLRCETLKAKEPGPFAFSGQDKKPADEAGALVVNASTVRTSADHTIAVGAVVDGETAGAYLRPAVGYPDLYRLFVSTFVKTGKGTTTRSMGYAYMRANQWVRIALPDAKGRYRGTRMLVQLVPVAEQ